MPERPAFPFVVGCGRSGTTLVRAMLDAHPQIAVPYESYFPVWFARQRSRYETPAGFALGRFTDDFLAHESFTHWGLDTESTRAHLRATDPRNYSDAVRACFAVYASAHGKPRYADKTPIFVNHIPLLASLFPEAVFLHMVRDGRDVALSRTQVAWGTRRFAQEGLRWRDEIERGRRDGRALGDARYRELQYEALLEDPERAARDVCAFVGVEFDPAMLRYYERVDQVLDSQPYPDEHQNLLRPPTKGLRSWRAELDAEQVALFEQLAGPTLRRFGYPTESRPASFRVRLEAQNARVQYHANAGYRRARTAVWRAVHARAER